MPVPYAAIAAAALPTVAGLFGRKKKVNAADFYTPDQLAAQGRLSNFAATGKFGNFTAGEEIPLGYGDYSPTGIEQQGLSSLQGLLSSGIPDQFRLGDEALQDLLQTSPEMIDKQFQPFKTQAMREIDQAEQGVRRGAAFAGNLYSTDTIKRLGDVRSRGVETLTSELARLTNQAMDRRTQAIPLAYQAGEARESLNMGRVDASQRYGALTRNLNDASIKARDAEILRRRQELQLPIQATETLAGQEGRNFPTVESSPYQDLLGMIGQIGGQYAGNELFMNQYRRFFPTGTAR